MAGLTAAQGSPQSPPWVSALLLPLELLAVAWSLPIAILVIFMPVAAAFWLGRMLLALF
jgi:hypothetical protein